MWAGLCDTSGMIKLCSSLSLNSSGRGAYELAAGHLALQFCVLNVAKSEPTEKKIGKIEVVSSF